jgi:hypothetical protein
MNEPSESLYWGNEVSRGALDNEGVTTWKKNIPQTSLLQNTAAKHFKLCA